MERMGKAIYKIKRACNLLFNDRIHKYTYKNIEPSGTVENAWKEVGKTLKRIMEGKE